MQLTFKKKLEPSSPIYSHLAPLRLLDLWVGIDDITVDKDYKHVVFKRVRNTLLREKGILVHGVTLTPALIRQHLRDAGHDADHLHSMFKPHDKQDVELAYHLLRDLWALPPADPARSMTYIQTREELRMFGTLAFHLILPYLCIDSPLGDQLTHLSSAAHLALALYVFEGAKGRFIPNTLFLDIMILIKNIYFCVAKAKVDFPHITFYIILLGTDRLEILFGILRTMIGNDANLDVLQLALRVTGTTEVANILAKHPEWDKSLRRLHLPTLSRDLQPIRGADHITSASWCGNLYPRDVTPATCWKCGRNDVKKVFPWVAEQLQAIDNTANASILAPFGTLMVDLPPDPDNDESAEELAGEIPCHHDEQNKGDVGDQSEGLRELEDAAVNGDWDEDGSSLGSEKVALTNMIDIDGTGTLVNKSRVLAQCFKYKSSPSSTDRLRRVAQEQRYKTANSADADTTLALVDGPCLSVPCLSPVKTSFSFALARSIASSTIRRLSTRSLWSSSRRVQSTSRSRFSV